MSIYIASNSNECSGTSSMLQGSLLITQIGCPTTADSAQFDLLCFQPEPFPETLVARAAQSSLGSPCKLSAWCGPIIYMGSRMYNTPWHSITQTHMGQKGVSLSSITVCMPPSCPPCCWHASVCLPVCPPPADTTKHFPRAPVCL